tara:strand:+ start:623 stop:832 length:210 start_codon:yes stop_codon:yes gene_type:complete
MPAHNVNTAALEKVTEAARRFMQISEFLGHAPLDDEDGTLDTSVFMMEQVLEHADPNAETVSLPHGRNH